jgi:hypothetical protein
MQAVFDLEKESLQSLLGFILVDGMIVICRQGGRGKKVAAI